MPVWLLLLVLAFGTYRITRLIVRDDFPPVARPRAWIADRGPEWLGELVTCPWCASGWIAMGAVAAAAWTVGLPAPVLCWPAVWGAAAWIAHHERDNPNATVVSARVAVDYPERSAMVERLRDEMGTLGLVRAALGELSGERRNAVLAAAAEWSGRRVDTAPREPQVP